MRDGNKQDNTNKDKILSCAQRLFYEKGYDCVGVQEIVDAAGITKPTMYYYFKSKHGLLECLLERGANQLVDGLKQTMRGSGGYQEILYKAVVTYIELAVENKEIYLLIISLFSSARDNEAYIAAKPYLSKLLHVVRSFFMQYANEQKHLKGREDFLAISFTGVINYYLLVYFERGASKEVLLDEEMIQNIVKQFL